MSDLLIEFIAGLVIFASMSEIVLFIFEVE